MFNIIKLFIEEVMVFKGWEFYDCYVVIYMDVMYILLKWKIVVKEVIYIVVGICLDGLKEVLSYVIVLIEFIMIWEEILLDF